MQTKFIIAYLKYPTEDGLKEIFEPTHLIWSILGISETVTFTTMFDQTF